MKTNPILKTFSLSLSCVGFLLIANSSNLFAVPGGPGENNGEPGGETCQNNDTCGPEIQSLGLDQKVDDIITAVKSPQSFCNNLPPAEHGKEPREGEVKGCIKEENVNETLGNLKTRVNYIFMHENWAVQDLEVSLTKGNVDVDVSTNPEEFCGECGIKRSSLTVFSYSMTSSLKTYKKKRDRDQSREELRRGLGGSSGPVGFPHWDIVEMALVIVEMAKFERLDDLPRIKKVNGECKKIPAQSKKREIEFSHSDKDLAQPSNVLVDNIKDVMITAESIEDQCLINENIVEKTCRRLSEREPELKNHGYVFPLPNWTQFSVNCAESPELIPPTLDDLDLLNKRGNTRADGAFLGRPIVFRIIQTGPEL